MISEDAERWKERPVNGLHFIVSRVEWGLGYEREEREWEIGGKSSRVEQRKQSAES